MGRPRTNPGIQAPVTTTGVAADSTVTESKIEVTREAHDPKYVAGIPGKRDRYQAAIKKAANLREGDVPCFSIAKDGHEESAEAYADQYGCYPLKDKDGKDIKHKELLAMGCPRTEFDAKIAGERAQTVGYARNARQKAAQEGVFDASERRSTNKKYFNMGG